MSVQTKQHPSSERDPIIPMEAKIVQITDWLPPEFSAVSQYAILIGEELATQGAHVSIVGLRYSDRLAEVRTCGLGTVSTFSVQRDPFDRQSWLRRLLWTLGTNFLLLRAAWPHMRAADTIRFTGSPPFLLHLLIPANWLLRKKLLYQITDFYPECIIAAHKRPNKLLELFRTLTIRLRRRVHAFEVLGEDAKTRLIDCGVDPHRISLRRLGPPVPILFDIAPLVRPTELRDRKVLLYSGNWGVAHDIDTFFEGYRLHHHEGSGGVLLWLNATGSGAEELDSRLRAAGLPFYRQKLVPLEQLPSLLVAPDAHLITLRTEFVGYVLPSKVYGCIASNRPIIFVGPRESDVHLLCSSTEGLLYLQVDVGEPRGVFLGLEALGSTSANGETNAKEFANMHI